jgi:uncharacterized cupin superfamily protein
MSLRKVNVLTVELDHSLDEFGFRHAGTAVGDKIGAERIGAGVYETDAALPIWPYHYHHGVEEWLYVIAGAPVLREPAGERALAPGDMICFPSGHLGAHTVKGPGRFVIFSAGRRPSLSVYPDSDKVGGPEGILLRSSAVGYWHGEGTAGPSERVEIQREPKTTPPQPALNAHALDDEATLGARLGAERLDASVVRLQPGEDSEPYHYVHGREEWLLVLAGTPTLRHAHGEATLEPGDLVCFVDGPGGAHQLLNRSDSAVRLLLLSTTGVPANAFYPGTGEWLIRNGPGRDDVIRAS